MPPAPTVKIEDDADESASAMSPLSATVSRQPSILDVMMQRAERARRPRVEEEESLPTQAPVPPQPPQPQSPVRTLPRVAATVSADNAFIVRPGFQLRLDGDDGRSPLSEAGAAEPPAAVAAEGIEPSASQAAIAAAAARDDPREVPMEWSLPGGPRKWGFLLPWLPLAALLQMWDAVADAPPPPDLLFTLHGLLGRCAGCYLFGQTKPTLMTHGAHLYYSDSAAQCPGCTRTKFRRGDGQRVDTRVWHEISTAELEGAYGRHTFAAVLYPTTSPQTIESVLRSTPVRELRLTSSALMSQLNRIAANNYLQVLHLSGCGLRDANLVALRSCAPQLRTLDLSGNHLTTLNAIAARLYELRSLDVSRNHFTAAGSVVPNNHYDWLKVTLPAIGKLRRFVCVAALHRKMVTALAFLRCVEELVVSTQSYGHTVDLGALRVLPNLKVLMTCGNCQWKREEFTSLRALSVGYEYKDFSGGAGQQRVIRPVQLPAVIRLNDGDVSMHADSRDLALLRNALDIETGQVQRGDLSIWDGDGDGDGDDDDDGSAGGMQVARHLEHMTALHRMRVLVRARQLMGEDSEEE